MSVRIHKWTVGKDQRPISDSEFELRVSGPPRKLSPASGDEFLFRRYETLAALKGSNSRIMYQGATELVVTRRRLLMLIRATGPSARGLNMAKGELAVVSIDRADLGPPEFVKDRSGKLKLVQFTGVAEPFVVEVHPFKLLEGLLHTIAPEAADELGEEAAEKRRGAQRQKEAEAQEAARLAKAEEQRVRAERFSGDARHSSPRLAPLQGLTMGLLDHQKTWHYKVAASPEQCVRAFVEAFASGGGMLLRAKWSIKRIPDGAVAVYEGRKGLGSAAAVFSDTSHREQAGAIGSEVRFEAHDQGDGSTICAMWLAKNSTSLVIFTNDARFFKPYMRAVEDRLRQVDSQLQVVKE